MGLIHYEQLEDGFDASANLWNERFGILFKEINGNLDAQNIKNEAITTAKIAPGAVTNDKLSIMSDYDNDGNWVKFGNFMIQWGTSQVSHTGTDITFAKPFTATPSVTMTIRDSNDQTAWLLSAQTTKFMAKQPWKPNTLPVSWIAVGQA